MSVSFEFNIYNKTIYYMKKLSNKYLFNPYHLLQQLHQSVMNNNIQLTNSQSYSTQLNLTTQMKTQRNKTQSVASKNSKGLDDDSLSQKLLPKTESQYNQSKLKDNRGKLTLIKEYFGQIQICNRVINFNGKVQPQNYNTNLVKNTKYNPLTFVPKVLYNQFKFFFNLFFLITALSQLVEILRVGLFITYIGPLILVLGLTMGKQGYDDYNTYKRDIEANSKVYDVIKTTGRVKTKSKDLKIGDIVVLKKNDKVPADMLILHSDNEQGTLFLKTDQLDGQTDWKLRKSIKKTQSMINSQQDYDSLVDPQLMVEVKAPDSQIYNFSGLFIYNEIKERLTLQNTMWTSTVLTNGTVLGLVLYIGRQTKISMGSSSARTKVGIFDHEINWLSKVLFMLLLAMTVVFLLLQWTQPQYLLIQFMRMLILLSAIIPISMRVNLDFAKLFYAYGINNDKNIQDTIARNSTIPEELGRVKYILSDKTGTLTQNQMIFKRISIQDEMKFTEENVDEIKQMLKDYQEIPNNIHCKEKCIKQIATALALCHNVTPVFNQDRTEKQFQASSPDQITFVKIAEEFGLQILERSQTSIRIKLPNGKQVDYQILYSFPFKSQTKRMGIILRTTISEQKQQITFYLKGADVVMRQFITNRQKRGFIDEECKDLSMTGLRTLVITKKSLKKQWFDTWRQKYDTQYNKIDIDQKVIEKYMEQLEGGVEFLGITGIQDKLQQDLKQAIQALKSANIKIWMITGDKIQTAQCISRSCGLQGVTESNVKIQNITHGHAWKTRWQDAKLNLNRVLIIDGKTLIYVLDDKQRSKDFFIHAMKMPSVICCRCSPEQKRTLTTGVKNNKDKNEKSAVLGIGDGGNDVGMIQAADLGVGIVGKQGKQAALAADFSIMKFKNIQALLLWHGRLSYKRSALLANFIIHRGFILSVMQLIFSCVFFYVSVPVFNSYLSLGFTTLFTFWPVFSLILDTDINRKNAMKYPKLYDSLQSSNELSTTNFLAWLWKASFQGSMIIILSMAIFMDTSYLEIQTICFTVLIITEYFMTLSEINRIHAFTLFCVGGSLVTYAACVYFLQDVVHVSTLSIGEFFFIGLIVAASWGPIFLWKLIRKHFWPTDYEKVMKSVKQRPIEQKFFENSFLEEPSTPGISNFIRTKTKTKDSRKMDLQQLREEQSENQSENSSN